MSPVPKLLWALGIGQRQDRHFALSAQKLTDTVLSPLDPPAAEFFERSEEIEASLQHSLEAKVMQLHVVSSP